MDLGRRLEHLGKNSQSSLVRVDPTTAQNPPYNLLILWMIKM
jgi:hypothetical protein